MKTKVFAVLIAILVIAGMLGGMGGQAMAEPNYVLSGRDKIGTFGKDGKSARSGFLNTITFEGTTYDTNKTVLSPVDPTGSNIILLQDASGTVAFTGASPIGATLTDTKILVGNSAGLAAEQGLSLINDIVGTMDNSGTINTTIADNAVGTAQANLNTVSVTIPATSTQGTATVTTGSTLLGAPYGVANIQFLAINGITNASISGQVLTLITNGTTGANAVVYKAVVMEP